MKHTYTKPLADLLSIGADDVICSSGENEYNENNVDVSRLFEI